MNDHLRPASPPPDADGELLSAYLAGELDEATTARIEERLAAEPPLSAALEDQRVVLELLAAAAPVDPPTGYSDRLRRRLAEEQAGGPAAAAAPSTDELADARARRDRTLRWGKVSGIAAVFVAVALVGGNVLSGLGSDDTTGDVAMEAPAGEAREFLDETDTELDMDDDAFDTTDGQENATLEAEADDASGDHAVDDTDDGPAAGSVARPSEPVIGGEDGDPVTLPDPEAVDEHLRGRAEAVGVLGIAGDDARDLAAAFEVAVRRAAPFPDGTSPSACLDTAIGGAGGPAVPVRVEPAIYEGAAALAYLVVTSSAGDGGALDRIETWVIEPRGCATRLFLNLSQP